MKPHRAMKRRLFRSQPLEIDVEFALEALIDTMRSQDVEAIGRGEPPVNAAKIDEYSRRLAALRA